MRIAFVVTTAITANLFLRNQLSNFRERDWDVVVMTSPGKDLDETAQREQVKTIAVPMTREIKLLSDFRSLILLYTALRRYRPTIVNASTPKAGLLGMVAAWLNRTPIRIYFVRGLRLETSVGSVRRLLLWLEQVSARCATHVVCNSHSLLAELDALHLAPREKLHLIGPGSSNGVCFERFTPSPRLLEWSAELRTLLDIPAGAVVIGFVGRFTRDKGIVELASAFAGIASELSNTMLLLVGDFEYGDPVPAETIAFLQAHPNVRLVGFVAEPAPYYLLMDVLAFPSYREGFPNAPLEAAAAGVPTVGFRSTGVVDAVVDGETGILVETGNVQALQQALLTLLTAPELRTEFGAKARCRATEQFSQEAVWAAWADFYSRCLQEATGVQRSPHHSRPDG